MIKLGETFGEHITTENLGKRRSYIEPYRTSNFRSNLVLLIILITTLIILIKLFGLQIIQGKYYRNLSDSNRVKTIIIHAPRGTIFDRNGKPLSYNVPGYRRLENGKVVLLSQDEAVSAISKGQHLEIDSLRQYPYKEISSQVLGYLGQISESQLKNLKFSDYVSGDLIGQEGIEAEYEKDLRGTDGKQLVEVDSLGKANRKLGETDPTSGKDVNLSLDINLQKDTFSAMKDVKKGAAIVSKPNGEILSMVSKPSFDPNLFTMGKTYRAASVSGYTNIADVLTDSDNQPLLNRAISGIYPPGSTFKLVVAASGLSDKLIDANWQIVDTGVLKVGDFSFSNWYYTGYGGKDGSVNVVKGIKRSNDIFFYKLAEKIGVDRVSKTAFDFGLGKTLGIDLIGESAGLVPTPEWKEKQIGEEWYLGDTYHYGIGQGYLLTTPLQVNSWTSTIATDGNLYRPHLLKDLKPEIISKNLLDNSSTNLIRQGMIEACAEGGVAWPFFNYTVRNSKIKIDNKNFEKVASSSADVRRVVVACKTGTAEHGDTTKTTPHAWITLFAPAYNPEVVVTVLAEEAGEGSNVAAPIAKKILDSYFSNLK